MGVKRIPQLIIVPEDGVPMRRPPDRKGKKSRSAEYRDPRIEQYVDALRNMRIGQSCFFRGMTSVDVGFLRQPCVRAGINIGIKEVARDEIHLVHGVRIWRQFGEFDEL